MVQKILFLHLKYRQSVLGIDLVNTINLMIFSKTMKISIISNRRFSEADIINYSQIDAENLNQIAVKLIFFVFGICEIIAGLALMYVFVGPMFLIALGIMVLINLISFKIGKVTMEYNLKILESKDERMNAT
jgi:ABC-type transport system involved in cytochrome bd biosynthesis fused ATPase/permease subunit